MTIRRHRLSRASRSVSVISHTSHSPVSRRRALAAALQQRLRSEQGDVPGWVLITLMTAGIVIALWAVASQQIVQIFTNALAPFLDGSL